MVRVKAWRWRFCVSSCIGELTGAHKVGGGEQFEGSQRRFEPAGGIQAWSQHEANIARGDLVDLYVGDACQREKSLALGLTDLAKPSAHQDSIFADEWSEVGHGAERNQIEQVVELKAIGQMVEHWISASMIL